MIRWLGSNVVYLSFFSNLILLASFLGIGIGFLMADRRGNLGHWLPLLLLVLVSFVLLFPVKIDRSGSDILFFGELEPSGLPIWIAVPFIFLMTAAVMASIGQSTARVFSQFSPLTAYRLDIGGSLLGVVGFSLAALLRTPPFVWAFVVGVLATLLISELKRVDLIAMAGVVAVLGLQSLAPGLSWSPYYQVETIEVPEGTQISVNGIPHQAMRMIDRDDQSIYSIPYRLHDNGSLDRVMIVGAGSGNDVAIALSNGANHIDAIEIDPALQELGAVGHPNQPYSDPRVSVIIDDGRAVMERSSSQYDMIIFALPDSLTLVSGSSGIRLESYLFTVEAFAQARELLKPGGTFALYNFYREDWLIDRLVRTVEVTFGHSPCLVTTEQAGLLALIAVGSGPTRACETDAVDTTGSPPPVTDDYPFLYLESRSFPGIYVLTLALIVVVSFISVRLTVGGRFRFRPFLDLMAMGVAFLLLETKSIVQFALWFGTTWLVNALVFAGVLVSVLAAVEVARRFQLPRRSTLYITLFVSLGVAWVVPAHALLAFNTPLRLATATLLTFTPIFVANLVFAQRFAATASSTTAFGANLLGAMIGGVLEYAALIAGYRALILIVALSYVGAFVLGSKAEFARRPA